MGWYTTYYYGFSPTNNQKSKFPKCIVWVHIMMIQIAYSMFREIFMCFSPYLGVGCSL